jgi:arabinose-5-phosphate isomerase
MEGFSPCAPMAAPKTQDSADGYVAMSPNPQKGPDAPEQNDHRMNSSLTNTSEPKRHSVLCVDDESRVLDGLALGLGPLYSVSKATGGVAALAILRALPTTTVIISDMRMPGMNGAEFLAASRKIAPHARRILLTGDVGIQSAIAAVNQGGIFRYLSKPCPTPLMLEAVEAAIADYEAEARHLSEIRGRPPTVRVANPAQMLDEVRTVFTEQSSALNAVGARIGAEMIEAVELILSVRGRVVVTGMGKSGIIGQKIAATLSSTGTPSFFVHPGDAFHGDLGMICSDDVIVLISYSGETEEVIKLLPYLNHISAPLILVSGGRSSTLAQHARLTLDVSVERETCPNNLAPTTSSTATLVMGDALAIALMNARCFLPADFAKFHPGGSLGRKLLTRVSDVMHINYTRLAPTDEFMHVMSAVTKTRLGLAVIVDAEGQLLGVISDGDMIRAMQRTSDNPFANLMARDFMTSTPITVSETAMFSDAESLMETSGVTSLVAINELGHPCGIVKAFDVRA